MNKPYLRQLFTPKLKNPIFIEGLPGFGNVGRITAQLLIKFTDAKLFAELYSPSFPDYVTVDAGGICYPPRYEFYESSTQKTDFIILIGNVQPSLEDVTAYYQLCDKILDFIEKHGCQFVVTVGGFPVPQPHREVYVAATSPELAAQIMEKGAIIYAKGRIIGATGLLLGLAKHRGMKGICLLGATRGVKPDNKAAFSVFKFLLKIFGTKIKEGL